MRMQPWQQRCLAVVALIMVVVWAGACTGGAGDSAAVADPSSSGAAAIDPQALLEDRCAACHNLDRVTGASKTEAEWQKTVTQMVAQGAQLTTEEQQALVTYLAETYGP